MPLNKVTKKKPQEKYYIGNDQLDRKNILWVALSVGVAVYTNCIFTEEWDSPNECPGYNTKQSYREASVMLELWGMQSIPLLPSLPGPLWPWVLAPDRALSMGRIELKCVLMLIWIVWNRNVFK